MIRNKLFLILISLVFIPIGCVKHQGSGTANEDNVTYAVINGQEIKGKEVLEKIKNELQELRRSEYQMKRHATEEFIEQKLLEEEAKKQGTTPDRLFSQFERDNDSLVSEADIDNFLKDRSINPKKLSKQEKASIPQIIRSQRASEARQKFVQDLRNKSNVQLKLQMPDEKIYDVGVGAGIPLGSADAKVKIIEFSDFQCPYCLRGRQRIEEIRAKYKDRVVFYFRNFPLERLHPYAFHAAEAAACVLEMNKEKFWDYHNTLFDHQDKLQEADLISYAKGLGLDDKVFSECLKSGKKQADIRKDMEDGTNAGMENGTPTFYVNGHMIRGAQPIETFSEIIEDQLSR